MIYGFENLFCSKAPHTLTEEYYACAIMHYYSDFG